MCMFYAIYQTDSTINGTTSWDVYKMCACQIDKGRQLL